MQHLQKPRVKTKYIIDETADPSFNTMLLQVCVVDEFASQDDRFNFKRNGSKQANFLQ